MNDTPAADDEVTLEDMTPGDFFDGIHGTETDLTFTVGGSGYSLSRSSLKVPALGEIALQGQFQEGDKLRIVLDLEIDRVHFDPIRDRHKHKVGIERRHIAAINDWTSQPA